MRKAGIFLLSLFLASFASAAPKVAVLNPTLDAGIDQKVGLIIVDKILEEMLKGKSFSILDRASRDVIWQERNFQLTSGEIDSAQIKDIGKGLGADYIVTVKVVHVGRLYAMSAQLIDVQTLEVIDAASAEAPDDLENVIALASQCGAQLAGSDSKSPPSKKPAATKAPAKPVPGALLFDPNLRSDKVPIGDYWVAGSDANSGGDSSAAIDRVRLDSGVLRFDYRIGAKIEFPWAVLSANLGKLSDLGKYSAVECTYRGKGVFKLEVAIDAVKDYFWHYYELPKASEKWQTVSVPFRKLAQADWVSVKVPFSLARVQTIQLSVVVQSKPDTGWLELSSMRLVP